MLIDEAKEYAETTATNLNDLVFGPIYQSLLANPGLREHLNPAFPFPKELRIGILEKFIAIEYVGPEIAADDHFRTTVSYAPNKNPFDFLGIDRAAFDARVGLPPPGDVCDMAFFLGESVPRLCDYLYDFTQMPMDLLVFGCIDLSATTHPIIVSNSTFFWTDESGGLKVRHIHFMELIPCLTDQLAHRLPESYDWFANFILNLKVPSYKLELHGALNSFIELINQREIIEPDITTFLGKNPEILSLVFGCHQVKSQVLLEWQFPTDQPNLKPDFMIEGMDGHFDIVDFKLPSLRNEAMVGSINREHPSFQVDSAIAQVSTYRDWCRQVVNRNWLEREKGIKVHEPTTYLIMGHRNNFSAEARQELREKRRTIIFTYDELIELARFQLYRVR